MALKLLKKDHGFTYIAALMIVVIMGIMLGAAGTSWQMVMKRERETELLFRGKQIVDAIGRWRGPTVAGKPIRPLNDLKDLLKDPNSLQTFRYLRRDPVKLYNDPVTGKEWQVIRDPVKGVIGVASTSDEVPLKQAGFVDNYVLNPQRDVDLINMYKNFEGKQKYSEWKFVYGALPATLQVNPGQPGNPATSPSNTTPAGGQRTAPY